MTESLPHAAPEAVVTLSSRLLFSFLRGAARLATRADLPLDRFVELAQLAYFQELRRDSPRDLASVARRLGVSLRTAGSLNRRARGDFFTPETDVEPLRDLTARLLDGPVRLSVLMGEQGDDEEIVRLERSLHLLRESGWLVYSDHEDPEIGLATRLRSFVSDDIERRLDGLNHQLDILVASVHQRFHVGNDTSARARSWFFAAREADVSPFIEETVRTLRHGAIDLEESALAQGSYRRFGVTIAITPVEDP
ncbi:MAG: hypothetical protein R3F61_08785 [Myxococcota bacterium]